VPATNVLPRITNAIDDSKLAVLPQLKIAAPDLQGAKDLGPADASKVIGLQLVLMRSQQQTAALGSLANKSQNPADPAYGKTLTPTAFAQQFGLAATDLTALSNWLTSKGLEVAGIDNGRMTINFTGTIGQVEDAFHTDIHSYLAKDGTTHFANTTEPRVPAAIAGVIGRVEGLQNFTVFRSKGFDGPVTDFAGTTDRSVTLQPGAAKAAVHLTGAPLADFAFTASKASTQLGDKVTLNVRIGAADSAPSGSLTIQGDKGVIGSVPDVTACESSNAGYGRSCTVSLQLPEVGMNHLVAIYSGDLHNRATQQSLAIPRVGSGASYTAEAVVPAAVSTTGSATYTVVTTYTGVAQLTGSVTLEYYIDTAYYTAKATYPAAGNTTRTGSGTSSFGNAYTYSCTTSLAAHTVTCTIVQSAPYADIGGYGPYSIVAQYNGDTNYATSLQEYAFVSPYRRAGSYTPSITFPSGNQLTSQVYGTGAAEAINVLVSTTGGGNAGGTASYPASMAIYDANQLGTPNAYSYQGACTASGGGYACGPYTLSWTNEPILAPGSYPVTFYFTGNTDAAAATNTLGPGSSTESFTVTQQAPTAAMTSATVTQTAGSLSAFTVTGTLAWTGVGIPPTSSDISFTSTAPGTFGTVSCTNTGTTNMAATPYTCSALFTPTSSDTGGSYNINLSFSGDTNYSSVASTSTGNYVIDSSSYCGGLCFTAVTHNLGSVAVGSSTQGQNNFFIQATNSGSAAIVGLKITLAGSSEFSTQNNCPATLAVGAYCEIEFTFSPTAPGAATATWSASATSGLTSEYPSNGGTLTGNGVSSGAVTLTTAGHNFGTVADGTTSGTYGVVLTNSTSAAVTLTLGSVTLPFTSVTNCPASLAAGASCNLQFAFKPTTPGTTSQTYSVSAGGATITSGGNVVTGIVLTGAGQ
jgi:hypothetical protein